MINRNQLRDLADKEYLHFENLKLEGDRGVSGINVRECEHYMRIWAGIIEFLNDESKDFRHLAPFERMEVLQALDG